MKLRINTKIGMYLSSKIIGISNEQDRLYYYSGFRDPYKKNAALELKKSGYKLLSSVNNILLQLIHMLKNLKILISK